MTLNDTAQPTADPQPNQIDANRTAGDHPQETSVGMTQAQIDAIVQSRLAEERRRIHAKYGDLESLAKAKQDLDALKEAELSELQKVQRDMDALKQQLAAKDAEIAAATLTALRLRVGQEVGLPPVLAARLQGADEAELKADADAIKAVLAPGAQPPIIPNLNATAGGGHVPPTTVKLTPSQRDAGERAVQGGLFKSLEDYAASLRQMQGD